MPNRVWHFKKSIFEIYQEVSVFHDDEYTLTHLESFDGLLMRLLSDM